MILEIISFNNQIHLFQIENLLKLQKGKMTEISLEDRVLKILQKYELPFLMDKETKELLLQVGASRLAINNKIIRNVVTHNVITHAIKYARLLYVKSST